MTSANMPTQNGCPRLGTSGLEATEPLKGSQPDLVKQKSLVEDSAAEVNNDGDAMDVSVVDDKPVVEATLEPETKAAQINPGTPLHEDGVQQAPTTSCPADEPASTEGRKLQSLQEQLNALVTQAQRLHEQTTKQGSEAADESLSGRQLMLALKYVHTAQRAVQAAEFSLFQPNEVPKEGTPEPVEIGPEPFTPQPTTKPPEADADSKDSGGAEEAMDDATAFDASLASFMEKGVAGGRPVRAAGKKAAAALAASGDSAKKKPAPKAVASAWKESTAAGTDGLLALAAAAADGKFGGGWERRDSFDRGEVRRMFPSNMFGRFGSSSKAAAAARVSASAHHKRMPHLTVQVPGEPRHHGFSSDPARQEYRRGYWQDQPLSCPPSSEDDRGQRACPSCFKAIGAATKQCKSCGHVLRVYKRQRVGIPGRGGEYYEGLYYDEEEGLYYDEDGNIVMEEDLSDLDDGEGLDDDDDDDDGEENRGKKPKGSDSDVPSKRDQRALRRELALPASVDLLNPDGLGRGGGSSNGGSEQTTGKKSDHDDQQASSKGGSGQKRPRGAHGHARLWRARQLREMAGNATAGGIGVEVLYEPGTIKHACYSLLSTVGAKGLTAAAIVERTRQEGYHDWGSAKTPENSVVAALSQDDTFVRVAPSTYALRTAAEAAGWSPPISQSPRGKKGEDGEDGGKAGGKGGASGVSGYSFQMKRDLHKKLVEHGLLKRGKVLKDAELAKLHKQLKLQQLKEGKLKMGKAGNGKASPTGKEPKAEASKAKVEKPVEADKGQKAADLSSGGASKVKPVQPKVKGKGAGGPTPEGMEHLLSLTLKELQATFCTNFGRRTTSKNKSWIRGKLEDAGWADADGAGTKKWLKMKADKAGGGQAVGKPAAKSTAKPATSLPPKLKLKQKEQEKWEEEEEEEEEAEEEKVEEEEMEGVEEEGTGEVKDGQEKETYHHKKGFGNPNDSEGGKEKAQKGTKRPGPELDKGAVRDPLSIDDPQIGVETITTPDAGEGEVPSPSP